MAIKTTELGRVCTGTRNINNTEWPIETFVKRIQEGDKKPYYLVTYNLCNGVPSGSKRFKTKAEALAELE